MEDHRVVRDTQAYHHQHAFPIPFLLWNKQSFIFIICYNYPSQIFLSFPVNGQLSSILLFYFHSSIYAMPYFIVGSNYFVSHFTSKKITRLKSLLVCCFYSNFKPSFSYFHPSKHVAFTYFVLTEALIHHQNTKKRH